ncbi:MAG: glycosyltransferase family 4 protein [Elusimicrobiota bacterium]
MKILFLTHTFPYPLDEGIKLMSWHLLKELSAQDEVALVSFIEEEKEREYISKLKNFTRSVETVLHKIPRSPRLRIKNILFENQPFCIFQFWNEDFLKKIKETAQSFKPDVMHFDFINTSIYRKFIPDTPAVFFPHDTMSMLFYRSATDEKALIKKFYYRSQWTKMANYEKEIMPLFKITAVVSPVDRDWLLKNSPTADIRVIPNGVDAEYFKPLNDIVPEKNSLIFRGIMNFHPNVLSAVYFHKEIFPLIKREIPDIKFYVVGKNPAPEIKALHDNKNTIVTGYVEDIRQYIGKSAVNVCPMITGSGIKNKVLEAMAMSVPTVATSMAVDGIPDAKDRENVLIANTPVEFVKKTIMLLKDSNLRSKIGGTGRKFVLEKYTWRSAAAQFRQLYREVTRG